MLRSIRSLVELNYWTADAISKRPLSYVMSNTTEDILHYQRKLVKYGNDTKVFLGIRIVYLHTCLNWFYQVLLHCLNKLAKLPIGIQHLQETGIGKTVNGMRKSEGPVGDEARLLVNKWKAMVAAEDTKSESENEAHEEEEARTVQSEDEDKKPKKSKKVKELKPDESPKEDKSKRRTEPQQASSSKSKPGSELQDKAAGKHKKKSSEAAPSTKVSKKRHRASDDSLEEEDEEEGTSLSFEQALGERFIW